MDRKEFLALVGMSAGGLVLASCLGGCTKQTVNVDFTLDLSQSANAALNTNGGSLVKSGVIVARTLTGTYIAVASACTHEGVTVNYISSSNSFYCGGHGARFSSTGSVNNGPASVGLQQFKTTLTGNSLRVYS